MCKPNYYNIVATGCVSIATSSPVAEYCQTEMFQASCAEDEVVIIDTAQYGRLDIGELELLVDSRLQTFE